MADVAALRARLRHVRWIGGGGGAGRSTTARRLAARHGLGLHATDDVVPDHVDRCPPADCPHLRRFLAMDVDQRWVDRSPETVLETFSWFRGEGFGLVVEDVLRLPQEPGVVVEASGCCRTWWRRGSSRATAGRTGDPGTALRDLLDRDRMFTERLREEARRRGGEEARRLGLGVIEVDPAMTEDDLAEQVAAALGL